MEFMEINLSNITIDELNYRASSSINEFHKRITNSSNINQKKRVSVSYLIWILKNF